MTYPKFHFFKTTLAILLVSFTAASLNAQVFKKIKNGQGGGSGDSYCPTVHIDNVFQLDVDIELENLEFEDTGSECESLKNAPCGGLFIGYEIENGDTLFHEITSCDFPPDSTSGTAIFTAAPENFPIGDDYPDFCVDNIFTANVTVDLYCFIGSTYEPIDLVEYYTELKEIIPNFDETITDLSLSEELMFCCGDTENRSSVNDDGNKTGDGRNILDQIKIYNDTNGFLLEISGPNHLETYVQWEIYNVSSQMIKKSTKQNGFNDMIDYSHFPSGIYYLRLHDGQVSKIVKFVKL